MTSGLLYADNYRKSLHNYHYWHFFDEATMMMGSMGVESALALIDAETMLGQRIDIQKGWMK